MIKILLAANRQHDWLCHVTFVKLTIHEFYLLVLKCAHNNNTFPRKTVLPFQKQVTESDVQEIIFLFKCIIILIYPSHVQCY